MKIITRSEEIKNLTGIREVVKLKKACFEGIFVVSDFNNSCDKIDEENSLSPWGEGRGEGDFKGKTFSFDYLGEKIYENCCNW